MDKKEQQAWDECLKLWKKLSNMPTQKATLDIKQTVLIELGIPERQDACPMCHHTIGCSACPIDDCTDKEKGYSDWGGGINMGKHYKSKAKAFYNYLLKRYEERKAEDN